MLNEHTPKYLSYSASFSIINTTSIYDNKVNKCGNRTHLRTKFLFHYF